MNPINIVLKESQPNSQIVDYELPGYPRFEWPEIAGANSYEIRIRYKFDGSGFLVMIRTNMAPRTYIHEGDFMDAGLLGLRKASYDWFVYHYQGQIPNLHAQGSFVIWHPDPMGTPVPVTAAGTILRHSVVELEWEGTLGATRFRLQLARDTDFATMLLDETFVSPCPNADGEFKWRLPIMGGDGSFTNDTYYWRVRGLNDDDFTSWSDVHTFGLSVDAHPAGPFSLGGDIFYFGKVTNGQFVVQAYDSAGFSLLPAAQVTVSNTTNAADWPENIMPFVLQGLYAGTYYVRAFLDQDGDKQPDIWETSGFVRENAYIPMPLELPQTRLDLRLQLTLADTDGDLIADDWEYQHFGNLFTAGRGLEGTGTLRGYTDSNNDGVNDYESYAFTPLNLSPVDPNAVGADGIPLRIKTALGLDPFVPLYFDIDGLGWNASGLPVLTWHGVTGANVQGTTAGRATMSSGGVELGFQIQYSQDLENWHDVLPGSGSVVYDVLTGEFEYVDSSGFDSSQFYRYRVFWSE